MKRKILALILCIMLVLPFMNMGVSAAKASGQCGDNAYWSFDASTGTLTITGTGAIWDYDIMDPETRSPFYEINSDIDKIVISDGVTHIGSCSFNYTNITELVLPKSVTSFGWGAFYNNKNLVTFEITGEATEISPQMFAYCSSLKTIKIPRSVNKIDVAAFNECPSLTTVYFTGSQEEWDEIEIENANDCLLNANIYKWTFDIIDSSKKFTDVSASFWAKPGIDYVLSNGYMNGVGDGTRFDPNGSMTRAMVVTVLYRLDGSPHFDGGHPPFSDIEAGSWYHNAVAWAYHNNIVTGTSASTFSPNGNVTREQLATILYRYANYKGYDTSASASLSKFPDGSSVNSWAEIALSWANGAGLITGASKNGQTVLDPQGEASRAQVATILMRFCEM